MNGRTQPENRYDTNRKKILTEAYRIVSAQGVDHLSMRSLAAAVQTSPANLYEYFAGKDEIIYELHAQLIEELAQHLEQVDASLSPLDYLEQVGYTYLTFAQNHAALFKLAGYYDSERSASHRYVVQNTSNPVNVLPDERTKLLFDTLQAAIQRYHGGEPSAAKAMLDERTLAFWSLLHGYATLSWLMIYPEYTTSQWSQIFRQIFQPVSIASPRVTASSKMRVAESVAL
ncbi:MAG: TetR/AcrR family transcriptional regulator [Caldilineaceae bacterium]|nr:TetR/AcrR family transcriptional regulator [Caldilineaceae bacterium]